MFIVYCLLFIVYCLLFIVYCLLFIVYCLLFIVYCLLFIVYCLLFIVYCLLFIVHCLLFIYYSDYLSSLRLGDPICDRYHLRIYKEWGLLALADGCSWGAQSHLAAVNACRGFLNSVQVDYYFWCWLVVGYWLLLSAACGVKNGSFFLPHYYTIFYRTLWSI